MSTLENTAPARRDTRAGGALDDETRQQVAELNVQGIGLIQAALAASRGDRVEGGAEGGGPGCRRVAPRRRSGTLRRRPAVGPADGSALAIRLAVPGGDGLRLPDAIDWAAAEWLSLDAVARQRLAACPYLLFELDVAVLLGAVAVPPGVVQEGRVLPGERVVVAPFAGAEGRAFAQLLFHYAWHLARSAPTLAAFVFGTTLAALEPLRVLGLGRVEALAAAASGALRLRWDREPLIWIDWLSAARGGDPAALWSAQLRGLQRIAGACREVASSV